MGFSLSLSSFWKPIQTLKLSTVCRTASQVSPLLHPRALQRMEGHHSLPKKSYRGSVDRLVLPLQALISLAPSQRQEVKNKSLFSYINTKNLIDLLLNIHSSPSLLYRTHLGLFTIVRTSSGFPCYIFKMSRKHITSYPCVIGCQATCIVVRNHSALPQQCGFLIHPLKVLSPKWTPCRGKDSAQFSLWSDSHRSEEQSHTSVLAY